MEVRNEKEHTSSFWLALPFIITSCFIIPMVVSGPNPGEEKSFGYIFVPGVALCIFPWSKIAALGIQAFFQARTFLVTKSMCESNPQLGLLRDKVKKWTRITVLTWILAFFSMMIGVDILNAGKSQSGSRENDINRQIQTKTHRTGDYHRASGGVDNEVMPPAFIENSNVHKRLQFYDNIIRRLIPLPFLGMLAGVIYLIRSLIGRWWKKRKKAPLIWKIVPFAAIVCFILPISTIFFDWFN